MARKLALVPVFLSFGCNAILGIDSGHPIEKEAGVDAADDATTMEAETSSPVHDAAPDESPAIVDALGDNNAIDAADGNGVCAARPPSLPAVDDNPTTILPDITLAIETLQVSDAPDKNLGLDLDGRCFCPATSACLLNGAPVDKPCDQAPDGRDIVGNYLLGTFSAQEAAFKEQALQARLDQGAHGALLRLSGYNGKANDQLVSVELFGMAWMPPPEGGAQPTPRKDGTDTWTVYNESVGFISAGPHAIERDTHAYVNNYTLVSHLSDATIALRPDTGINNNALTIQVHDAYITGKLVPSKGGFRMESGTIAGRWPSDRILASFAALADVNGSICGSNNSYKLLKFAICNSLDIASKQANDNPQSSCDAVSFGFGFTAGPALIADAARTPDFAPNNCGDDWQPTCNN